MVWVDDAPNDSPWYRYPKRMLQMRARSWALRDSCADILRGLSIREEVEDMPQAADEAAPLTARQAVAASAPPPPEEPPQIAAPAKPPIIAAADELETGVALTAAISEVLAEDAAFEDDAPPEEPPETPPAVAKVDVDDVAFVRNIEAELKKLAIGDPDLFARFEAISTAAEGRMEGMFPPDAGALSDLLERYRKELDL